MREADEAIATSEGVAVSTGSEAALRLTIDHLLEGVQVIGFDWTYLYLNLAAAQHARRPASELIGRTVMECYPGVETTAMFGVLERVMSTRKAERLLNAFTFPNSLHGSFELLVEAVPDGICVLSVDVTEQQNRHARLQQSEERARFAMHTAGVGVWELGVETRAVHWSESLEAMAGLAPGDGPKTVDAFMAIVDPEDRPALTERLEEAVHSPQENFSVEFRLIRPDGERRLVESHARFLPNGGGQQVLLGVGVDVTDRRVTELGLQQARKMEAVGRLAGGIAHDFNNLLTAILGYTELLLERVQHDSSMTADLEEIRKAGQRAGRLTRQLLAFSRRQVLLPKVLDLNAVVLDLDRMLSRISGEDVRLEFLIGACLDRTKADPGQIEQLLMHLVINARDAMPQGGALRVRTDNVTIDANFVRRHKGSTPGRYVLLEVEDTGSGMGPDVLAHVFEPFFTTKAPGKGTGLGLATVYGIVKQSDGYVSVDSEPGVGTTVRIYLPAVTGADEPAAAAARDTPEARSLSGTETVLVCDDDAGIRHVVVKTLEQHGYTVLEARDTHHAIAIAENHEGRIDLLLTDIVTPDVNGPNLAQQIVQRRPSIKVLYVSGVPHSVHVSARSLSSRATLLAKPFTPTALAASVRECLDR